MKKLCVVSCPIATRSGYGSRSRDLVRSLIETKGEEWDIKILPQRWGNTPQNALTSEDTDLTSRLITGQMNQKPDVWMQITIPSEFQPVGHFNIGVSAVIETTAASAEFIEGCNRMDLNIVSSEHSKTTLNAVYDKIDEKSKQKIGEVKIEKPVEVLLQAMLRRGEGHVLMITASDALTVDITDHMWRHAMTGAIALIVDDVQEFAADPDWNHQLGVLLDQALNLGLQVVAGGRGPLADYAPSRLKEVLSTSPSVRLRPPNASTLLAYGRWRCGQKNLLVSDGHLAQLARMRPTGWRPFENRLTEVALAMERGSVLLDHDDVADLLSSSSRSQPPIEQQLPVEDLATQLVGEVLDSVYSSVDAGGVDLHAPLSPLSEDDYEPPEWDSATFAANRPDGFEERLKATIESVSPSHPSVLEVHERERHLLNAHHRLEGKDVERAVDVLVDLDESIDRRMGRSDAASIQETTELNRLEEQMVVLAQRAVNADIEELITIADDLRELEERLVAIDPDREPLPPFENDAPSERRRVGRRRSKPASSPQESLDEYEPEGEWDIDGTGIEASDLLEDEPTPTPHVVHLARLHKRHVLAGEEE